MATNAPPSFDPTDGGSFAGAFKFILKKFLSNTNDMLPAKVIAFDRTRNRVQVQPLISMVNTNGEVIERAQIASLPVFNVGGGGFILSFNLVPGNLGWIKANDRDLSLFLQTYDTSIPNTQRQHDFSDALFIPDVMTGWTIADEDAPNAVFQTLDGTVRVVLWADKVKITAPLVVLDTPLTHMTGDLHVDGEIRAVGNITAGDGGRNIDVLNHIHQDGGGIGDSGPPVDGT